MQWFKVWILEAILKDGFIMIRIYDMKVKWAENMFSYSEFKDLIDLKYKECKVNKPFLVLDIHFPERFMDY